ncbi:MAG TPA: hypothetical protein VFL92_05365 [Sphingomonas sp.]|nr:hypothetical protein [Sphingomonas sp.]
MASEAAQIAKLPAQAPGRFTGVAFPTSIAALVEAGPEWLTRAFHATGALPTERRVVAIERTQEFFGGGMGRKLILNVRYDIPGEGLDERLFCKFPRDFGDPLRDLFGPLMEPEIRFALLSRRDDFPLTVPACFFGDYDPETRSGLLITARVPYGEDSVEPAHDKCLDYEVEDPLGHYRALTKAMARLAAAHKAGRIGAEIDRQFPFDANGADLGSRIPYTADELAAKLAKLKSFAADHLGLFPDGLGDPAFLDRFSREAMETFEMQDAIRRHLNGEPDLITLCHWNMNLDNAWFWRDEEGKLQVGLLDWGSVAQMNLAQSFFGMICAAETDFLDAHEDGLITLLLDEYHVLGGPAVDQVGFVRSLRLAQALLGVAWMLDAPALIEREVPAIGEVKDRRDPRLRDVFLARAQHHLLVVLLNEWRREDIGGVLRRFHQEVTG